MIQLDVPLLFQRQTMECWHASARMLHAFRRRCVDPLSAVRTANTGISAAQFIDLARDAGLSTVPVVRQTFGAQLIEHMLKLYGPLWCAGRWDGVNHIVVTTGVDGGGRLMINDPNPAVGYRAQDLGWFNERLAADVRNPIMYLTS